MKFKNLILTAALSGSLCLTGCASIVHGTTQDFTVDTTPANATLSVDGVTEGQTPIQISLKRDEAHTLKISLSGYEPVTFHLQRYVTGWVIGNIVFGGLIGLAVDASDGAMYSLSPEQLHTYMKSKQKHYDPLSDTFTVILVKAPSKQWKKVGQLQKAKS